jgi:DNA-binding response OmpR family regulator
MKKVLIIEDDQIVANIYRNKFTVEGYLVEVALDGESGLDMIRNFRPDAVILDLMLPKISGVEVMKKIRAERDFEKLPLIVFSNTYLSNMVQEAWKAGATKCLSKAACTPRQVLDVLRSTTGSNGSSTSPAAAPARAVAPAAIPVPTPATPEVKRIEVESDAKFEANLRESFIQNLPATLTAMRASLKELSKADTDLAKLKSLADLHRRLRTLTANAGITGMALIAQLSDALEALIKELHDKPANINTSTLRTVATAVDFLGVLFGQTDQPQKEFRPTDILVVDDDPIARRAITHALEKAKLTSVSVEDPNEAHKLISENSYDLIFLDVDMPSMNGFELCTKLRSMPKHKKTPVVFVTSLNDLENRASSMMSGGNDFIGKPFLMTELAVKGLLYVLRSKLARQK